MSEECSKARCSCCGKGHFCEPDNYPTELGQTWTCPECGLYHEAFDVHAANAGRQWVQHIPQGTLGWRSFATTTTASEDR